MGKNGKKSVPKYAGRSDGLTCGVYRIRCLVSGKSFIGSSIRVGIRWKHHRQLLKSGKHHAPLLQKAWNKHGENAFVFELVEVCSVDVVRGREQYYIDLEQAFGNGYNGHPEATPYTYMSETIVEKMKIAARRVGRDPKVRKGRSERAKAQHASGNLGQATWRVSPKSVGKKARATRMKNGGYQVSLESIKKMSQTKREIEWNRPGRRERQAEIASALQERPGHKEYLRSKQAEYWTPERREAQRQRALAQHAERGSF